MECEIGGRTEFFTFFLIGVCMDLLGSSIML